MLEDYGKSASDKNSSDKNSEPFEQIDTEGNYMTSLRQDSIQALRGDLRCSAIGDALTNLTQWGPKEKVTEGQKTVQDSEEAAMEAAMRIIGGRFGQMASKAFEKRAQISDCGFGEGQWHSQRRSEIDESMRRIRQIDLKPYMWNTLEIRY